MKFNALFITAAAALALGTGCTSSDSPVDYVQVTPDPPHDALRSEHVAQAEIAFDAAVKKADGDRNFAISQCAKSANSRAMECMNKADADFAAATDHAKTQFETARM